MRCSKCGSENREGRRFCRSCGSKLGTVCRKCGAANEADENFCGDCGTELVWQEPKASGIRPTDTEFRTKDSLPGREAVDEERKTVTALFADLKGSTELMESLDPEDARAIVDPALRIMVEAVRRYDGYVVQSTGDGIFALFGAPAAYEDHPQRAVFAALQMQQHLQEYARQLASQGNRRLKPGPLGKDHEPNELEARVGINTGEVLVRTVETGGKVEYTPVGHTANLASRLQTVAPAGSIAVSEHTSKLVEGYFELRALGPMQVRGISEPIDVYEVTGVGPLRTHFQLSARRGLTKFVGREREISELERALELAKSGYGQIVAAVAEAGSGKSRLIYEFKSLVRNQCAVLEAYSVSHGKASPYQPVLELLHSYFNLELNDDRQRRREKISTQLTALDPGLADTLPYVLSLLGLQTDPDALAQLDAQIRRRRTLEAIKRILLRYSVQQTLVLIFEDLHWVDGETQALLDLLADSIGNAPVLLLVNYRPEYHHGWGGKSYYVQLRLDPLRKESAQELLTAMLGDALELWPIKRLIIEKTGGNPFFIEEMVQTLLDQRVLVRNGSVKITRSLSQLHIPETVQGILAARIDRLAVQQKELLQILSVLGKNFSLGLVESVVPQSEDELQRALHALQLSEFIYERPGSNDLEFSFKHALTQEVAYNSLLIERRRLLHASCGNAIEALFSDHLDDYSGQLAYHYSHSADAEKALTYLVRAGDVAARRSANAEAAIHFNAAADLLSALPDTPERAQQELELDTKLGPILMALKGHGSTDAEKVYRRGRQLCERIGETPQLFPVLWGLWLIHSSRGEYRKALDLGEQLLVLARQLDNRGLLLQAEHALWNTLVFGGEFVSGLEHARQGIALYDPELHRSHALVYGGHDPGECCRRHAATALWLLGYPDQAMETARSGLRLAQDLGHPHSLSWAMLSLMMLYQLRREIDEAEKQATAVLTLSSEHGFAASTALSTFVRAWARSEAGCSPERAAEMRQALVDARTTGLDTWRASSLTLLAERLTRAHQPDEGLNLIEGALILVGNEGRRWYEAEVHRMKGELLLMRDRTAAQPAGDCFRSALEIARRQRAKSFELRAAMSLSRLLANQDRRDEARTTLAEIYNWFTEGFDTADLKEAKALLDELAT